MSMSSTTSAGLISLVPSSGIQFLDIDFDIDRLPRGARSFPRWALADTGGAFSLAGSAHRH